MKSLALLLLAALLATSAPAGPASTVQHQGTVLDAQHRPVAGALVECYGHVEQRGDLESAEVQARATTDAAGQFLLTTTNQGFLVLVASKPGLSLGWASWYSHQAGDEAASEILLTPPATVSGRVQDAAGQPVAGAEVWVRLALRSSDLTGFSGFRVNLHLLHSAEGRKYLAARSGAGGEFRIAGLPKDARLELEAAKPGLALEPTQQRTPYIADLSFHAGQSNIVLTLVTAGALEGQVVQEKTGAPLPGARVLTGASWQNTSAHTAVTGSDGKFHLAELAPGEYELHATFGTNACPDWVCEPVRATVTSGQTNRTVQLTASRGGVLEVAVQDAAEQPLEGVTVSAYSTQRRGVMVSGPSASTSARGLARLRLCPGDYSVSLSREGWRSQQLQVSVQAGQTNREALTLEPCPQVTGQVLDPAGKPAANIPVRLFPFGREEKRTDAQGRFTLLADLPVYARQGAQVNIQINLLARDPARNLVAALPWEEGTTNVTLKLAPGLTLAGCVTNSAGQPIAEAQVQVMGHGENGSAALTASAAADDRGRFEVNALPANHDYTVDVSASGYGRSSREVELPAANTQRLELEPFALPLANLPLAGVVLDAEDKPVAGAMVSGPYRSEQPQLHGQTDAHGRFRFDHVCAGSIQLNANLPDGGYGSATAEGGDTNVTIRLQARGQVLHSDGAGKAAKVSGRVLTAEGQPAAGVELYLLPHAFGAQKTDAQGRFTLQLDSNQFLSRGSDQRVLIASDPIHNLAAALELEPETTNAELKLEPGWAVAGQATDLAGKPLTNAEVQMMAWAGNIGSSLGLPRRVGGVEGRFELKGLVPGHRYRITVTAKNYGRASQNVEAPEAGTNRVELEPFQLAVADQRVAGVVVDADEKPVAGASVFCIGDKQPNAHAQTDSKGRFALNKLCAGSVQLSANSPAGGYANVTADAGDTNIIIHLGSARLAGRVAKAPSAASLKGKPLPDLAALGLKPTDAPPDHPVLVVLVDAEQRPSRRVLRLLSEQAAALKEKGLAVVVLQAGEMTGAALNAWKTEAALPFPVVACGTTPEKARATWGAASLPWLILADQAHRVAAEGFGPEELAAKLQALSPKAPSSP